MGNYSIKYRIENKYENVVRKALFNLLVLPYPSPKLKVLHQAFKCSCQEKEHRLKNLFGFEILQYFLDEPFTSFVFELEADVFWEEVNPFDFQPLDVNKEHTALNSVDFQVDNSVFLRQTQLTQATTGFLVFPDFEPQFSVFDYLLKLNEFIHNYMAYIPGVTNTATSVPEIITNKAGVCQDFAHLFIHVCRKNKIPCRYVSGYLFQGGSFVGAGQLHAWVEGLIPEVGWVGLDPTNNLLVDRHYIKIAHGTDYTDCSPIIGVLENTGEQVSKHSVIVNNQ